jgi:DNA-directed RNA polymerase subunit RPC12/RpoP
MDIIFNCPKCEQELAVDNTGAGSEINCPACSETIVIPAAAAPPAAAPTNDPTQMAASTIHTSAAAKVEMHLKVPVHTRKPAETLIEKPIPTLEASALESDKKLRIKTIEVGHDRFDEFVTNFLQKTGEQNIISVTALTYTHLDIGSQKLMSEYAVLIMYRG